MKYLNHSKLSLVLPTLLKVMVGFGASLAISSVQAEWTELDKNEDAAYFWDKESVKAIHVTRYAWTLTDLPKSTKGPTGDDYQSLLTRWRVHCKTDMFIKISESYYDKPQGKGKEVASFDDPEWRIGERPIRPGTYVAILKKELCSNPGS